MGCWSRILLDGFWLICYIIPGAGPSYHSIKTLLGLHETMRRDFLSPQGRACLPVGRDKGEGENRFRAIETKKNPLTLTLSPEGRGRRRGELIEKNRKEERPPHPHPLPGGEREKNEKAKGTKPQGREEWFIENSGCAFVERYS